MHWAFHCSVWKIHCREHFYRCRALYEQRKCQYNKPFLLFADKTMSRVYPDRMGKRRRQIPVLVFPVLYSEYEHWTRKSHTVPRTLKTLSGDSLHIGNPILVCVTQVWSSIQCDSCNNYLPTPPHPLYSPGKLLFWFFDVNSRRNKQGNISLMGNV